MASTADLASIAEFQEWLTQNFIANLSPSNIRTEYAKQNEDEEEEWQDYCIGCETGADHQDAHTAACNLANGFYIH
jgi:hypothetical protein